MDVFSLFICHFYFYFFFITARCTTRYAIVSRPSVCLSVCNDEVPWSYKLGYFESSYTDN